MATSSEPEAAPAAPDSSAAPSGSTPPAHRSARPATSPSSRGVLVVPALLVVALVLLVVGLVTSRSVWLAASLVASVLAAVLLVVERLIQARRSRAVEPASPRGGEEAGADAAAEPEPPVDLDAPAIDPDDPEAVWVVDGRPRYHTRDCATIASLDAEPVPRRQALEDGFVACSLCSPAVPAAKD